MTASRVTRWHMRRVVKRQQITAERHALKAHAGADVAAGTTAQQRQLDRIRYQPAAVADASPSD